MWHSARWRVAIGVVVLGMPACGGGHDAPDAGVDSGVDAGDDRIVVAELRASANEDVDILFAIDDSPASEALQTALKNGFPEFLSVLNAGMGGLPNVHIGVISSDVGTQGAADASPGPSVGTLGQGGCAGSGKAGNLQTNGTTLVSGAFISDVRNTDGTRSENYVGTLEDAFSVMASLGSGGCGFEQPIQAVQLALNNNAANSGFLRQSANLAVIMVTNEDDCSMAHSTLMGGDASTLGALTSFRCTRFGVTCDVGGATSDEMNMVGQKSECHSNEMSPYLMPIAPYAAFLRSLKQDPRTIYFGTIIGPPEPVAVELQVPLGGGAAIPALAHSCSGTGVGDPAVRIAQLGSKIDHHSTGSVCAPDDTAALIEAGLQIRLLVGDACLSRTLSMPLDCVVTETAGSGSADVPACSGGTMPCWELATDAQICAAGSHQRFVIQRSAAPPPDTVDTIRCRP